MESGYLECGGTAASQQCRKHALVELSPIHHAQGLHAACTVAAAYLAAGWKPCNSVCAAEAMLWPTNSRPPPSARL